MRRIARLLACATLAAAGSCTAPERSDDLPSPAVPRLYRVILPMKDVAATPKWYEELLAMKGEFVSTNRFYLHCGPVILALVEPDAGIEARPNQDYVYLAVQDLEAFHARAAKLGALDAEMGSIAKRPWGERSFYAHDPLGNPLCFVEDGTLFTGGRVVR